MADSSHLAALLQYLRGTLPPEEVERLERELLSSDELLRDLLHTAQDEATLIRWARAHRSATSAPFDIEQDQQAGVEVTRTLSATKRSAVSTSVRRVSKRRLWRYAAAGVALVLLLAGMVGWLTSGSPRRYAATLVRIETNDTDAVQLTSPPGRLAVGDTAQLQNETAEIVFQSGARVVVEGPAALTILGENSGRLQRGVLSADVPSRAIGFLIETPSGRVVDRSTRFGVAVVDADRTEVEVFEGEVSASVGGRNDSPAVNFTAGNAMALDRRQAQMTAIPASLPQLNAVRDALKQKTIEASDDHFVLGGDVADVVQPSPDAPQMLLKRFHPRNSALRRKIWIRFEVAGEAIDLEAPYSVSFRTMNPAAGDVQRSHFVGILQAFALRAGYAPPPGSLGTGWQANKLTWNNAPGNRTDHIGEITSEVHLGDIRVDAGPGGAPPGTVFSVGGPRLGDVLQSDGTITVVLSVRSQQGFDPNLLIASRESPEFVGPTLTVQLQK